MASTSRDRSRSPLPSTSKGTSGSSSKSSERSRSGSDAISLLTCPVCLETLCVPKILPCFHSFCLKCLEKLVSSNARTFLCPSCRRTTVVPPGGPKEFQTNFYMDELLANKADPEPQCEGSCSSESKSGQQRAVCRCSTCAKFYCRKCITFHDSIPGVRADHRVFDLKKGQAVPGEQRVLNCKKHPDQVLCFWCVPCKVSICVHCKLTGLHDAHKVEDQKDAGTRAAVELNEELEFLTLYSTTVEAALQRLQQDQSNMKKEATTELTAVQSRKDRCEQWIEEAFTVMLTSITDLVKGTFLQMERKDKELRNTLAGVKARLKHIEDLKRLVRKNSLNVATNVAALQVTRGCFTKEGLQELDKYISQDTMKWFEVEHLPNPIARQHVMKCIGHCNKATELSSLPKATTAAFSATLTQPDYNEEEGDEKEEEETEEEDEEKEEDDEEYK